MLPLSLHAEPWDRIDKGLGIAAVGALVVDWGQTRYIAKHPQRYQETNQILGEHPSVGRVNLYFTGAIIGTLLFADWLPSNGRKIFLGSITALELVVTSKNQALGIKIAF
jgi:hypothetical protein